MVTFQNVVHYCYPLIVLLLHAVFIIGTNLGMVSGLGVETKTFILMVPTILYLTQSLLNPHRKLIRRLFQINQIDLIII